MRGIKIREIPFFSARDYTHMLHTLGIINNINTIPLTRAAREGGRERRRCTARSVGVNSMLFPAIGRRRDITPGKMHGRPCSDFVNLSLAGRNS